MLGFSRPDEKRLSQLRQFGGETEQVNMKACLLPLLINGGSLLKILASGGDVADTPMKMLIKYLAHGTFWNRRRVDIRFACRRILLFYIQSKPQYLVLYRVQHPNYRPARYDYPRLHTSKAFINVVCKKK